MMEGGGTKVEFRGRKEGLVIDKRREPAAALPLSLDTPARKHCQLLRRRSKYTATVLKLPDDTQYMPIHANPSPSECIQYCDSCYSAQSVRYRQKGASARTKN